MLWASLTLFLTAGTLGVRQDLLGFMAAVRTFPRTLCPTVEPPYYQPLAHSCLRPEPSTSTILKEIDLKKRKLSECVSDPLVSFDAVPLNYFPESLSQSKETQIE